MLERLRSALPSRTTGLEAAATRVFLEAISTNDFSRIVGRFAQAKVPKPLLRAVIAWYVKQYKVDLSEVADPIESFETFDAFFTRTLKPGIHVVDPDRDVAVSPVDGRVLNVGRVAEGRIDQVKGRSYALDELLDSAPDTAVYAHGWYITLYLSPRDYHRIHSPADGKITRFRYVPGRLYPVNAMGVNNVDRLFAVNERLITHIDGPLGKFAVVKVGATNVGLITASYTDIRTNSGRRTHYDEALRRPVKIARGGELGQFHLGSTVVLISERPDLVPVPMNPGDFFRMGQRLLRRS